MRSIIATYFTSLKNELSSMVKQKIHSISADIECVKSGVKELETGFSVWSDKVTTLQTTINSLTDKMAEYKKYVWTWKVECEEVTSESLGWRKETAPAPQLR